MDEIDPEVARLEGAFKLGVLPQNIADYEDRGTTGDEELDAALGGDA